MEDKKRELLRLIEGCDIEELFKLDPEFYWCGMANKYSNICSALIRCQKQKTIEQKLEDLGFKKIDSFRAYELGLNYDNLKSAIYIEYRENRLGDESIYHASKIEKSNSDKIIKFANYLVNLKNGAAE